MRTLKALLLSFVFVLSTSLCYSGELRFDTFSAAAYKTGNTWEAYMLTALVDENDNPVEGVMVTGIWDEKNVEICHTDKKGRCKFHSSDKKEDYMSTFRVSSAEKKGYVFKDKDMTMGIMRP